MSHLRRGQPRIDLHDKVAIVVDDGVATGATARVACRVARQLGAARVVLAVPVVAAQAARELSAGPEADEVVSVSAPRSFRAVGAHYRDFTPTTDDEVVSLLKQARERAPAAAGGPWGQRTATRTRTSSFPPGP